MAESIFYWLVLFGLITGFWFVYAIVKTEFGGRRERRKPRQHAQVAFSEPPQSPKQFPEKQAPDTGRGYDSPELLRQDSLIRIKQLERDIARHLRDMERRKENK